VKTYKAWCAEHNRDPNGYQDHECIYNGGYLEGMAAMTEERDKWKKKKYASIDNTSRQLEDVLIATRAAEDKALEALKAMRPECDYESDEEMERCIALRNGIISELEDMK
jgi:hypothetical protein